jgi:ubiquinone/menaquinone biosynthesis C-methylase UbiE
MVFMNKGERAVIDYYNTRESKQGYMLFLKGTKHFGYYNPGDRSWQFNKALRQMEALLAQKLALPKGAKVLDAGCGMGDVASYLAKNQELNIEGIDILDFNIKEAKKRITERGLADKINVQIMSYGNMQFDDSVFDGAYTMETFVHSDNPEKALSEFYRVLKPGGKLVMFEYSRDPDEAMSSKAAKDIADMNRLAAMPAFQQFTHGVLEARLQGAGFKDIHVEDISAHMMPMVKVFSYVAYVPVMVLSLLGMRHKLINGFSGVILWKHRKHFRYNVYTATKPLI